MKGGSVGDAEEQLLNSTQLQQKEISNYSTITVNGGISFKSNRFKIGISYNFSETKNNLTICSLKRHNFLYILFLELRLKLIKIQVARMK